MAYWILSRSCGYAHGAIGLYAAYLLVAVWLPGHCLLIWCQRGRVGLGRSLALGLPLGFVHEILFYLACAAAGGRDAYLIVSLVGALTLAGWLVWRSGWRQLVPTGPSLEAGAGLLLSTMALVIMMTMAAKMYAPAPMADGLLLHSTHHDWVYLVSRAAEIRNHWPLEDPSLAGTPLSYHYFLMTHVAAAAQVTGLEIPLVLLRLVSVPMGVALLAQAFVLGRLLGRSVWAGVLATVLLFATGEVSWAEPAGGGLFQSLFLAWLYISPTFFFGMVFMGAMMLWMHEVLRSDRKWRVFGVLFLLAVVGTGAKGTTVGPLAAATALWCIGQLIGKRVWPWRLVWAGLLLVGGFLTAYWVFLRGYSGNGTAFSLFAFPQVSAFWLEHVGAWQALLEGMGLASGISATLAKTAGSAAVLAGLNGVLLLGLVQAFRAKTRSEDPYAVWIGFVAVACIAFGNLLFLDSHGESYLYLPMKLPLAVLTATAVVAWWRDRAARARLSPDRQRRVLRLLIGGTCLAGIALLMADGTLSWWGGVVVAVLFLLAPARDGANETVGGSPVESGRYLWRLVPVLPLLLVLVVQVRFFALGNRSGFLLWKTSAAAGREQPLIELQEALDWLRRHTPVDAMLIAASFSPERATPDLAQVVDRTTMDKHYYYSALAERRLFIEGPAYVRDQTEATHRMQAVARIVRGEMPVLPPGLKTRSVYLLVDHAAPPKDMVSPPSARVVFENRRVSIYRLSGA